MFSIPVDRRNWTWQCVRLHNTMQFANNSASCRATYYNFLNYLLPSQISLVYSRKLIISYPLRNYITAFHRYRSYVSKMYSRFVLPQNVADIKTINAIVKFDLTDSLISRLESNNKCLLSIDFYIYLNATFFTLWILALEFGCID